MIDTFLQVNLYFSQTEYSKNNPHNHFWAHTACACADPGIFVRGGPGQSEKKKLFVFSPQLILQKSNGQFQRNLSFFKVPEGVRHFPGAGGGSNFFQGGPIAYSL